MNATDMVKITRRLEQAGFTREQVEALTLAIAKIADSMGNLATRDDVAGLRRTVHGTVVPIVLLNLALTMALAGIVLMQ